MPRNPSRDVVLTKLAALADVIAAHTDGMGRGIAYDAFVIDRVQLPAAFVAAVRAAGFVFDPQVFDSSGWQRYPARDHAFTAAVEGWGDHCLQGSACTRREFAAELARRAADDGEQLLAVVWRRIPLVLHTDREGLKLDPPLRFRVVSFTAVAGYRPYAPGEDPG